MMDSTDAGDEALRAEACIAVECGATDLRDSNLAPLDNNIIMICRIIHPALWAPNTAFSQV
jgi:hypothetical protein